MSINMSQKEVSVSYALFGLCIMMICFLCYAEDNYKIHSGHNKSSIKTTIEYIKDDRSNIIFENSNLPKNDFFPNDTRYWKINYWNISETKSNYLGQFLYTVFTRQWDYDFRLKETDVIAYDSLLFNKDTILTIVGDPSKISCDTVTPATNAVYTDGLCYDFKTKYHPSAMRRKFMNPYRNITHVSGRDRITNAFIKVDEKMNINAYLLEVSGRTNVLSWKENVGWEKVDPSK